MTNPMDPALPVTTPFGKPGSWAAGFHTGDDYACSHRHKIVATGDGTVVYAGNGGAWGAAYGLHVIVDVNGRRCMSAHMDQIVVGYGQRVKAGQLLGYADNSGRSTGTHNHYEERVNPYRYGTDSRRPILSKQTGGGGTPTNPSFGDYTYKGNHPAHRALQRRLKEKGHDPGFGDWPTDYYGDGTKDAVASFQRAQGWSGSDADGMPGPGTLDRLGLPQKLSFRSRKRVYLSKMVKGQGDSDSVWNVQIALLRLGYSIPNGPTDYFGEQTRKAVSAFQRKQGWTGSDADGYPGPGTIKALGLQYVDDRDDPDVSSPPPVDPPKNRPEAPSRMPVGAEWAPIRKGDGWVGGLRKFSTSPGGAPKIVLHTTETDDIPNWDAKGSGYPHFTYDIDKDQLKMHISLDMAAYTLKGGEFSPNSAAGVAIQIEIVGRAKDVPSWSKTKFDKLRELLVWIANEIDMVYVFPFPFTGGSGWGIGGEVRQTWERFRDTPGIVGHSHAPYNNHWDPGDLPVEKLLPDEGDRPGPDPDKPEPEVPMNDPRWSALVNGLRDTADAIEDAAPEECDGYEIQKGDTFWSLSQKWGVSVKDIQDANPGVDPTNLEVGDCIQRP